MSAALRTTKRPPRPRLPLFTGQVLDRYPLPKAEELALHFQVADLLRASAPPSWRWTHFPAGERRDPGIGAKLKRMGLATGWPDFLLLSPASEFRTGRLHCLELKRKGAKPSGPQAEFAAWCFENGIEHVVADTFEAAEAALQRWGAIPEGRP